MRAWYDTDAASKIGINCAVLLNYIAYWCCSNRNKGDHIKDGKAWMYATIPEIVKSLGFPSERTLRRTILELKELGYISIQQDANSMNRTNWYTVTEDGMKLANMAKSLENQASGQNGLMQAAKMDDSSGQNGLMQAAKNDFPTNNTKKDIQRKTQRKNDARAKLVPPFDDPPQELIDAWEGFIEMRKAKRNTPTEKAVKLIANKLEKLAPGNDLMKADILNQSTERGWQGVFPLKADYQRTQPKTYGAQQSAAEMYEEVKALMENGGGIL